jgi:hypothetical protein
VTLYNCIAHSNKTNLGFGSKNPLARLTLKNNTVLGPTGETTANVVDISHNSWQSGLDCDSADFQSTDLNELTKPRQVNGSLPQISYLHLVRGSNLIDKGVPVALPFHGLAPDLGAFEYRPLP